MATQTLNDVRLDVAAIGEQFRKTTETAAEQTRQTLGVAQERLQENVSRAQQAQTDLAKTMFRLSDQNTQLATAYMTTLWDASISMLKLCAWSQDQAEKNFSRFVDQARASREEGMTLLNDTLDETRHNQAKLYRLTQETVRDSFFYAGKVGRREAETAK